ncbi:glycosyltransferase family 2 protein, partial [bacterium]|nr:glycosyltransferase family 2 protein [bacterium]
MIDEISFIIPVFNERETLPELLKSLGGVISGVPKSEIIVINDASTDGSEGLVPGTVRLINSQKQCGYGASIKKGLRKAEYSKICIIDADGTYPPEAVRTLLENYRGEDMLVGKRENLDLSPLRRPVKWIINKFAGFLTGEKIPDLNSGLRIFKKDQAMKFFSYFPDGFSFTTTITAAFLTNGMTVNYEIIPYL